MFLKEDLDEYFKRKIWYWYLPMWFFGIYVFIKLLDFSPAAQPPLVIVLAHSANFLLHEFAHVFTEFLPFIFTAAAGSVSELLLGIGLVWGAFKGKTYFASMICCLWLMLSCMSAAEYMSDARSQALPLVNFDVSGETQPTHDWNYVFGQLGILEYDKLIGGTFRVIGILAGLFGLAFAAWLIYKMAGAEKKQALNEKEAQLLHEQAAAKLASPAPAKHFEQVKDGSLYPAVKKGWMAEDQKDKSDVRKNVNLYPTATKGKVAEVPKKEEKTDTH